MNEFEKVKTYEPTLVTSGFAPREDANTKVRMIPFEGMRGHYVKIEDYNKLYSAYKKLLGETQVSEGEESEELSQDKNNRKNKKNK